MSKFKKYRVGLYGFFIGFRFICHLSSSKTLAHNYESSTFLLWKIIELVIDGLLELMEFEFQWVLGT